MEKESKDPKTLFEDLINEVKNDDELISGMKEYNRKKKEEAISSNKEFEEFMEAYIKLVEEMNSRGLSKAFKELYPDYEQEMNFEEVDIPVIDLDQEENSDRRIERIDIDFKKQEESKKKKTISIKGIRQEAKSKYKELDNKIKKYKLAKEKQKNDKKVEKEQEKIEKIAIKALKQRNKEQERAQRKEKIKNSRVIKGAKTFAQGTIIVSQVIGSGIKKASKETAKAVGEVGKIAIGVGAMGVEKAGHLYKKASKRMEERKDQTILSTLKFIKAATVSLQGTLEERISKREELNKKTKPKEEVVEKIDESNTKEL